MTLLLQISDPHFGTTVPAAVEALNTLALAQKPDLLILSGDITQRATTQQFAEAKSFCERLQITQQLVLPGNHDIPLFNPLARLVNPYSNYQAAFGAELEPVVDLPWLLVVGVNTTRWYRHKNGEVSAEQVARVSARLKQATSAQLRVVVTHQPVHVMKAADEHDRLRGWEPAVRSWAEAGADIIMGGHIHLPYIFDLSTSVPGLHRPLWCVQAGTALSSRTRQGMSNSVNMLRFDPAAGSAGCSLERWDFRAGKGVFELANSSALALHRALGDGAAAPQQPPKGV